MVLRFSANLGFLWPDRDLLDRIDAAARAGFKAIELHWPYDVQASDVRDRCRQHGLSLLAVNTARGNVEAGEMGLGALAGRQDEFQAAVDQAIRFCVEAGGSAVHCMPGKVLERDRRSAHRVFVENLKQASAKAAENGLTLLLEPLNTHDAPGYFYSTLAGAAAVLEETDQPNIKLMFDAYHVGASGKDVIGELETYFPWVGHVQIAAVPTRDEPDQGTFDYRPFFRALERLAYDGWVGAEYKPRLGTDDGLRWMTALCVAMS